jgi:hypothetical protein
MNFPEPEKPPYWYWMIASFGILWNVMGIMSYVQQVVLPQEMMAGMTPEQRAYLSDIPAWINTALAFGVWGGFVGSILLLMRNGLAFYVLLCALAGTAVDLIYILIKGAVLDLLGFQGLLFPFTILIVALVLVLLARYARWRSWLN